MSTQDHDFIVLSDENIPIKINIQQNINDDTKRSNVTTIKAETIDFPSKSWEGIFDDKPSVIKHIHIALSKSSTNHKCKIIIDNFDLVITIESDLLDEPLVKILSMTLNQNYELLNQSTENEYLLERIKKLEQQIADSKDKLIYITSDMLISPIHYNDTYFFNSVNQEPFLIALVKWFACFGDEKDFLPVRICDFSGRIVSKHLISNPNRNYNNSRGNNGIFNYDQPNIQQGKYGMIHIWRNYEIVYVDEKPKNGIFVKGFLLCKTHLPEQVQHSQCNGGLAFELYENDEGKNTWSVIRKRSRVIFGKINIVPKLNQLNFEMYGIISNTTSSVQIKVPVNGTWFEDVIPDKNYTIPQHCIINKQVLNIGANIAAQRGKQNQSIQFRMNRWDA